MRILIGTVGQSLVATEDGTTWQRMGTRFGIHSDGAVRMLVSHPSDPHVVFAATDRGVYRTDDGGSTWQSLGGPLREYHVWSLAIDPSDPSILFAGTGIPRGSIWRSTDDGASWQELAAGVAPTCENVGFTRVLGLTVDPTDTQQVWAALEVDGVRHSIDGGETWTRIDPQAIPNPDVHAVAVTPGPPKTVYVVVNNDIYTSQDDGATWRSVGAAQRFGPYHHVRDIVLDPRDPRRAWATVGDATPGETGALMRTADLGESWETVYLPVEPNSAMWRLRLQEDNPDLVLAASRYGYLYRSDDGGASWTKLRRELSEVASLLWVPN